MLKQISVIFLFVLMLAVFTGADFYNNQEYPINIQGVANDKFFTLQKNLKQIHVLEAWDITTGKEIIIALIDTGVYTEHEDIVNKIWSNPNEIPGNRRDDDGNGYVDDVFGYNFYDNNNNITDNNGHGTSIAGIIGANTNNNLGIAAINWKAKIMVLKALNELGGGEYRDVARAIRYAVDNGAKIINMSFGTYIDDPILRQAIDYAVDNGVVVVGAAGNNGQRKILYPAAYSNVISVGAVDSSNNRASFSNYGEDLDVVAPGLNIPTINNSSLNGYSNSSGTSYAAAHVSGLVSLIISQYPNLTPTEVKALVLNSATLLNDTIEYGAGIINALSALQMPTETELLSADISTSSNSILADGIDFAIVTVTLKKNNQIISNRLIDVAIGDISLKINQTLLEANKSVNLRATDNQGRVSFTVKSSTPGQTSLTIIDHQSGTYLGSLNLIFNAQHQNLYQLAVINQSPNIKMELGETATVRVKLKNTGTATWFGLDNTSKYKLKLGTAEPLDRNSMFYHYSWTSNNRAAILQQSATLPGESVELFFIIKASKLGKWQESFKPVIEYKQWLPIDITWDIEVTKPGLNTNPNSYQAKIINQSNNLELKSGDTTIVNVVLKNTGSARWLNSNISDYGNVRLGTYQPMDRFSKFYYLSWLNQNRVIQSGLSIGPSAELMIGFVIQAPNQPGIYYESFRLVSEHITWFGPTITLKITVTS